MLPSPSPSVVCTPLAEGAVLFDARTEQYFGLNVVGARIWELLPSAGDVESLHGRLHAEYPDVDAADLRRDVEALLENLVASGLAITGRSDDTPRATEAPDDAAPPARTG